MPWRRGRTHFAVPLLISTQQGISLWIGIRESLLSKWIHVQTTRGVAEIQHELYTVYVSRYKWVFVHYILTLVSCVCRWRACSLKSNLGPLYASRSCHWRHHNTVISLAAITTTAFGVWLYQFAERTVSTDAACLQTLATKETDLFSAVTACVGLIVFPEPSRSRLDKHLELTL
jgi:hypothetical protein